MKYIHVFAILLIGLIPAQAQVLTCNFHQNTLVISTNTTIGFGGAGASSILVCGGATLFYAENSGMDSIYLEPGAKLVFDSTFSYGYARVHAKSGSYVDMNWRQTGQLNYENGVVVVDSNTGPPSFFFGTTQYTTLNYVYTNLPGGTGCAPTGLHYMEHNAGNKVYIQGGQIKLECNNPAEPVQLNLFDLWGRVVFHSKFSNGSELSLPHLPSGLYLVKWRSGADAGTLRWQKL